MLTPDFVVKRCVIDTTVETIHQRGDSGSGAHVRVVACEHICRVGRAMARGNHEKRTYMGGGGLEKWSDWTTRYRGMEDQ
jgi:hypothetical protein